MSRKIEYEHPGLGRFTLRVPKNLSQAEIDVEINKAIGKVDAKLKFEAIPVEQRAQLRLEARRRGRSAALNVAVIASMLSV